MQHFQNFRMNKVLVGIVGGMVVVLGVKLLLRIINKLDGEKLLPQKTSRIFAVLCFIAGSYIGLLRMEIFWWNVVVCVLLLGMSYTDFHEKKIYNICNLFLMLYGITVLLVCRKFTQEFWAYLLVCILVFFILKSVGVFAAGDQRMLTGMAICMYLLAEETGRSPYVLIYGYVALSFFIVIVLNLKKIIRKRGKETLPYAPAGMIAYLLILGLMAGM